MVTISQAFSEKKLTWAKRSYWKVTVLDGKDWRKKYFFEGCELNFG